jgi:hypothetical protein
VRALLDALHVVNVRIWAYGQPEAGRPDLQVKTAHIVTPATTSSTHYFLYHARNFAQQSQAITSFMHEGLLGAFREDVAGLEAIEGNIAATPAGEFVEVSFNADRAGWLSARGPTGRSRTPPAGFPRTGPGIRRA